MKCVSSRYNATQQSGVSYANVALSCGQTAAATVMLLSVSSRYDKMNELQTMKLPDSMQIHYKPQTMCLPAAKTPIICHRVSAVCAVTHVPSKRDTK